MALTLPSLGLCPTCGMEVPRSVSVRAGCLVETYRCPQDGQRSYGPHGMPTEQWAAPPMTLLRTMPGVGPAIDWL